MHLDAAERILQHPALSPELARQLTSLWPQFYLGNIAPDVQALNGMAREATHFYKVPPDLSITPTERMLRAFPELADAGALPPAQAAFLAGYQAHLLLDMVWLTEVAAPLFFFNRAWDDVDIQTRRVGHFIMLTYLDQGSRGRLPADAGATLSAANGAGMTPFVPDADMAGWQRMIATQLMPGAALRTVEIYAERLRMTPTAFAACLNDPAWMEQQLFGRVDPAQVKRSLAAGIDASIELIADYLSPVEVSLP